MTEQTKPLMTNDEKAAAYDQLRERVDALGFPTVNDALDGLARSVASWKESVVAFLGPHAATYAKEHGYPEPELHPVHYDLLKGAGARMDSFIRGSTGETE